MGLLRVLQVTLWRGMMSGVIMMMSVSLSCICITLAILMLLMLLHLALVKLMKPPPLPPERPWQVLSGMSTRNGFGLLLSL